MFDYTDPAFIEGVQDSVGQAILNGSNLEYDDVANTIAATVAGLAAGNGVSTAGNVISVTADPNSPDLVTVSAAGLSVQALPSVDAGNLLSTSATDGRLVLNAAAITALATVDVCDLSGTNSFKAFP